MRTWLPVALVLAACAEAHPADAVQPTYLALGDSIAFGWDPLLDRRVTEMQGYPEVLADRIAMPVTNASCPGEASGGFWSPFGIDNHCRENRQAYPLHAAYEGTQLDFALDWLSQHPEAELVTIDIGGNDAGRLQASCAGEVSCMLGGVVPMLTEYEHNLERIFSTLRNVYDGPLIALAIYNPFPNDQLAQWALDRLNGALAAKAAAHGAVFVDGMKAFRTASSDPCADGLLIAMPDGRCDIHPSARGDAVLAGAIETALAAD